LLRLFLCAPNSRLGQSIDTQFMSLRLGGLDGSRNRLDKPDKAGLLLGPRRCCSAEGCWPCRGILPCCALYAPPLLNRQLDGSQALQCDGSGRLRKDHAEHEPRRYATPDWFSPSLLLTFDLLHEVHSTAKHPEALRRVVVLDLSSQIVRNPVRSERASRPAAAATRRHTATSPANGHHSRSAGLVSVPESAV